MTYDELLIECDRANSQNMPAFVLTVPRKERKKYGKSLRIDAGLSGFIVGSDSKVIFVSVETAKVRAYVAAAKKVFQ